MIEIDQSYIKEIPAPPTDIFLGDLAGITVDMDVLSVLEINEVEGIFAVQFALSLTWVDKRLVRFTTRSSLEAYLGSLG